VFKNIVIVVLAVLLCAGAISSRPGEESFKAFYRDRAKVAAVVAARQHKNLLQKIFKQRREPRVVPGQVRLQGPSSGPTSRSTARSSPAARSAAG
jgi:hypothetical protein